MIYLIGGPPRTGKSLITSKVVGIKPMYAFCCDFTYDTYDFTKQNKFKKADIIEKGELYYSKLQELVFNIARQTEDCVIEGEVILPRHAAELSKLYDIRACFLGLSNPTMETILNYGGHFNWVKSKITNGMEEEVADLVERTKHRSKIIKDECSKYTQSYFDLSNSDYDKQQQLALNYLLHL